MSYHFITLYRYCTVPALYIISSVWVCVHILYLYKVKLVHYILCAFQLFNHAFIVSGKLFLHFSLKHVLMNICIIYLLQKGFDTLLSMVPDLSESSSGKESRSAMLFKCRYLLILSFTYSSLRAGGSTLLKPC